MNPRLPRFDQEDEESPETRTRAEDYGAALKAPGLLHSAFLLVTNGPRAGTMVRAQDGMVIGRAVSADVVLESLSVSRRHAVIRVSDSGEVTITDLDSRNALIYEGERVTSCMLAESRPLRIGDVVLTLLRLEDTDDNVRRNLVTSGSVDFMTNLLTEHALSSALSHQFLSAARASTPLSYVLLEVDQLGSGVPVTRLDRVLLRHVGIRIRKAIKIEEQVIIGLRGLRQIGIVMTVELETAIVTAERCRAAIAKGPVLVDGVSHTLTVSVGVAADALSAHDLLVGAEAALVLARRRGGDCVVGS